MALAQGALLINLIGYLGIFRCWGPYSCLISLPSASQVPTRDLEELGDVLVHWRNPSCAGWWITPRPQHWRSRRSSQKAAADVAIGAQHAPGAARVFPARHQGKRSTNLPGRWRLSCVSREQLARLALAWLGLRFGLCLVCSNSAFSVWVDLGWDSRKPQQLRPCLCRSVGHGAGAPWFAPSLLLGP